MKTIDLYQYGVENILKELTVCLKEGADAHSKKQKDKAICEALGTVYALRELIIITNEDEKEAEDEGEER